MQRIQTIVQRIADADFLKSVIGHMPFAAFIVYAPEREIAWCNTVAQTTFGYDSGEMIGETTFKLHVDRDRYDEFQRVTAPVVSAGRPYRGRFWMRRKNGSMFASEHLITPVQMIEERQGVVSFVQDLCPIENGVLQEKIEALTGREREVFLLTAEGLSVKEIAFRIAISPRTVEVHRARILEKFESDTVHQLMAELLSAARASKLHL